MVEDSWTWRPGPGATRAERAALGTAGRPGRTGSAELAWNLEPTAYSRRSASARDDRRGRSGGSRDLSGYGRDYSSYGRGGALPNAPVETHTARRVRRRRRSSPRPVVALILLGIMAWIVFGYVGGLARIVQIRHEMTQVKKEMSAVLTRNRELEKRVAEMRRPEYIEKIARTELGLIKPDEVKFVMAKSVDGRNPESRDVVKRPNSDKAILH